MQSKISCLDKFSSPICRSCSTSLNYHIKYWHFHQTYFSNIKSFFFIASSYQMFRKYKELTNYLNYCNFLIIFNFPNIMLYVSYIIQFFSKLDKWTNALKNWLILYNMTILITSSFFVGLFDSVSSMTEHIFHSSNIC